MLFAIFAVLAYSTALLWIVPTLVKAQQQIESDQKPNLKIVFGLGIIATVLHLINLFNHLLDQQGLNFTLPNVVSFISVMMSLIATLFLPKWRTLWFPLSVVYLFGIMSVALSSFVEGSFIRQLAEKEGLLFHLAVAIFSYALFFLALLYAIQLNWLDRQLKNKTLCFSPMLPPLMTVERHFFTLTFVAQLLLTVALITGMIYLHNFFAPEQIHKAIFSFIAWIVYSILLLGQWKLHWRGKRVLIYSISGMILLTIGYFGSRAV